MQKISIEKFCKMCGAKLAKRDAFGFNTETGDKSFEMHCPTEKCYHTGNYHDFKYTKGSFWVGPLLKCSKCGEINNEMRM